MSTLVCFHAHPDDESIATGGTMAKAAADGHRVVLVVATRGEVGEVADGFLDDGESLAERRVVETEASAGVLGVARVEFLGYVDSGMMGEPTNDHPDCFWRADVEEAARRLAAVLRDEAADALTVYDANGNYGHPDHIQVHRVGVRAAELAGTPRVFEATMNRDFLLRQMEELRERMPEDQLPAEGEGPSEEEVQSLGSPEAAITHGIDVAEFTEVKRASMRCHASQIPEDSFFLSMPDEVFRTSFGVEWYIEHGTTRAGAAPFAGSLLD
jgi:LmbE family N-acetylglucosaminyl deacetylase